ncbi:hypothetical protein FISHEDRAFT_68775 [Fistulina hepatica ATCC 64428]|uniref:Uncharacterized protein n=1 Tax=Fistulina hepatica ATCC 64428 TaxID=1128425 RepID=A0A0D7ANW9_9AGAR|nr:hypothetical protein FISHEDRAFT_68775 [Fistulina hepatica ATCC 64428]
MSKQTEDELDTTANDFMNGRLWDRSDTTSLDDASVVFLFWLIIPQEQRPPNAGHVRGFLKEHPDVVDLLRKAWKSDKSTKTFDDTLLYNSANAGESTVEYHLEAATDKLLEYFESDEPDESIPFVILAFDEAHTLTSDVQEAENLDYFRIFSVFLSTTAKITQFSDEIYRPAKFNRSTRVRSGRVRLIPAFTTLEWDNLAQPLPANAISEGVLCKDIGFDYEVLLGRPLLGTLYLSMLEIRKSRKSPLDASDEYDVLSAFMRFVGEKLTGCTGIAELPPATKFAVLAQRFPLEFKVYSDAEREQVERHLRTCVAIDESFVSMVTTNSSEPILSEAARFFMRQADFKAPGTLLEIMRGGLIDKGDCGELIVLLLLTLARDKAAGASFFSDYQGFFGVVPFLKALFVSPPEVSSADIEDVLEARPSIYRADHEKDVLLKDAFENTFMHFNHFVKRGEADGLDFTRVLGFLARNAAVLCAKTGINGAIPMISGTMILRTQTALFLFRVKNDDDRCSAAPDVKLFTAMNPRSLGFEDLDVPVIRVMFSLGRRRPALRVVPQSSEPDEFTSYDIWASGLSGKVFCTCKDPRDAYIWHELLRASTSWKDLYKEKDSLKRELQMQTTPMAGNDDVFWKWIGPAWKAF